MGECRANMCVRGRSIFRIFVGTHNAANQNLLQGFAPDVVSQGISVGFSDAEVSASTFTITRKRGSGVQEEDTIEEFVLDVGRNIWSFSHGNFEGGSVLEGRHGSDVEETACEE